MRELRNVVFGALVGKRAGDELLLSDLPRRLLGARESDARGVIDVAALERAMGAGTFDLRSEKERLERLALEQALSLARGNAARAAGLLGAVGPGRGQPIPGGTVRAMMRRLGARHTEILSERVPTKLKSTQPMERWPKVSRMSERRTRGKKIRLSFGSTFTDGPAVGMTHEWRGRLNE